MVWSWFRSCLGALSLLGASVVWAHAQNSTAPSATTRPEGRIEVLPATRWDHLPEGASWTRAALGALQSHGAAIPELIPRDFADWCPAYADAPLEQRRAFWVGFLSALAKHESTWRPAAVGGGGRWFGLVQIAPATARFYGCDARSGAALKDGVANLRCAVRIMATTVPRDGMISRYEGKWGGVAADWGPLRSTRKRTDMQTWLREQTYCRPLDTVRPRARPPAEER